MSLIIKLSKDMRMKALKVRNQISKVDDVELMQRIEDAAGAGDFNMFFVHTAGEDYPVISAGMIRGLKKAGYKINLWDMHKG